MPRLEVLGHMSEVNNRPEIARRTVATLLDAAGLRPERLDAVPQGVMRSWTAVPRAD